MRLACGAAEGGRYRRRNPRARAAPPQLIPGSQASRIRHVAIATIAIEKSDTTRAIQALDAFLKVDGNDVECGAQASAAARTAWRCRAHGCGLRARHRRRIRSIPHAQTIVGRRGAAAEGRDRRGTRVPCGAGLAAAGQGGRALRSRAGLSARRPGRGRRSARRSRRSRSRHRSSLPRIFC